MTRSKLQLALVAALLGASFGVAHAKDVKVTLTGSQEVPPVTTAAKATGEITIKADKTVTGKITTKGIEGTMAGLGHAGVGLPYAHQRPCEVAAAALGLERLGGVTRAEPDGDAVAEPDLLGASFGAVDADRAHRPLQRQAAGLVERWKGGVHRTEECDERVVTGGCRGVPRVSGNCK